MICHKMLKLRPNQSVSEGQQDKWDINNASKKNGNPYMLKYFKSLWCVDCLIMEFFMVLLSEVAIKLKMLLQKPFITPVPTQSRLY